MINSDTAATMRLMGLIGIGLSVVGLVWAGGNAQRGVFCMICKFAAFIFAMIYFFGLMVTAESELPRVIPRFP
jgi:hypothetical protein